MCSDPEEPCSDPEEPTLKRRRHHESSAERFAPGKRPRDSDRDVLFMLSRRVLAACAQWEQIFEWVDGALVQAMRSGDSFLLDEISLADDSVLERLNSVLEPCCSLLLAERPITGSQLEMVRVAPSFRLFATLNPGGDF